MAVASPARRIFLTGGTGYLGSRLIPLLIERGHHVRALAREASQDRLPPGCEAVIGNPLDERPLADGMRGCDTVVQLVGVPKPAPWKGPQFRAIDGPSAMAAIRAAAAAGGVGRHRLEPRGERDGSRLMARRACDGAGLLGAFRAAVANLESHVDEINALNVYPVPDGDTGSNMAATAASSFNALRPITTRGTAEGRIGGSLDRWIGMVR